MNTVQYGFTPQKGTINVAMKVKNFFLEGLAEAEVIVLVSLESKVHLIQHGGQEF